MGGGNGGGGNDYKDAKDFLDKIGKEVHEIVKKERETYKGELEGKLSFATNSETNSTQNPCEFDYDKPIGANSKRDPCRKDVKKKDVDRFSDKQGAQCDYRKIRDSTNNNEGGACAPFRRLFVCNKNLESIKDTTSTKTHKLLAQVCFAAKHEGESISLSYPQYEEKYPAFGSTICTILARSFADIGDIVRGKDLYRRDKGKIDKLEDNLKKIFAKIHDEVTKGSNGQALKTRYEDDENYYKLREDWWEANRETVWKAITCSAHDGDTYFGQTCDDHGTPSNANHKCRCMNKIGKPDDQVPTYFDYVPQYLRWFEEWAEDFCRIKRGKLQNLEKECRGQNDDGKKRYCSRNAHDCEKTVRAQGVIVMGNGCTKCFYACPRYEKWIDKQKEQFEKQKKKYAEEIKKYTNGGVSSGRRTKGDATTKVYDGYEKKFYNKLKDHGNYSEVNNFLELLNNETICTKNADIKEGGKIDFKEKHDKHNNANKTKGTFYRSDYCDLCPVCGVECDSEKCTPYPEKGRCPSIYTIYKSIPGAEPNNIKILKSGDGQTEIAEKLKEFCDDKKTDKDSLYELWQCYKDKDVVKDKGKEDDNVNGAGGLCILEKNGENVKTQKTFHNFFYYWVAHMLKDSIYWKTEKLDKCLRKKSKKCGNPQCTDDCNCYENWVGQKRIEWEDIKKHFKTQEDIPGNPLDTLELVLKLEFAKENSSEDAENNVSAEEIDLINKMLKEEEAAAPGGADNEENTPIDKLIKHEQKEAETCKQTQEDCKKPQSPASAGRSLENTPASSPPAGDLENEEEEEEEYSDDDSHQVDEVVDEVVIQQETTGTTKDDNVEKVCNIVNGALTETNLKEACSLKYGPGGKEKYTQWRCIPSTGNGSSNTSEGSSDGGGRAKRHTSGPDPTKSSGSICVPPRRRRLYVTPIIKWAEETAKRATSPETNGDGDSGETTEGKGQQAVAKDQQLSDSGNPLGNASPSDPRDGLRDAFIQSAAVETFFLWDRYKKIKEKEREEKEKRDREANGLGLPFMQPVGVPGLGVGAGIPQPSSLLTGSSGALSPGQPGLVPGAPSPPLPSLFNPNGEGGGSWADKAYGSRTLSGHSSMDDEKQASGELLDDRITTLRRGPGPYQPQQPQLKPQLPLLNGGIHSSHSGTLDPNDPANLNSGEIPPDFLRQMFYTLGDYRDILFSSSNDTSDSKDTSSSTYSDNLKHIVLEAGGNEQKAAMEKIQEKITSALKESDNKDTSVKKPVQDDQNSDKKQREDFWTNYGKSIWEGMLCALTYNTESGGKDQKIEQDTKVKTELYDKNTKDTGKYHYDNVTLEEESGEKTNNPTTLKNFVVRPPYFRYLEEWGNEFCLKRTEMLTKIKVECNVDEDGANGKKKCSGYGEDCETNLKKDPSTFPDLECHRCGEECRKYEKWIKTKKTEYEKQSNAYMEQKNNCENGSEDAKKFCEELKTKCDTAGDFLNRLKSGPCKNENDGEKNKKGEDEIKFDVNGDTFQHTKYCDPCSKFKIHCETGDCNVSEKKKCNGGTITAENIKNNTGPNGDIEMRVSDNSGSGFDDDLKHCEKAGIFMGIRKDEWKCGNVCGYEVCKPKNRNGKPNGDKHIITIRGLVAHWVHNFLEDYNKIKHKISHCIRKGEEPKCIKHCDKKCKCVKEWVEKKRVEWKEIKNRLNEQYKNDYGENYNVKTILEKLHPQTELNKAMKPCGGLEAFEKSCDLNRTESSKTKDGGEDDTPKDLVQCLLKKLEEKIKTCADQTVDKPSQTACQTSSHVGDVDPLEEENPENTVEHPKICGDMNPEPEEDKTGETCTPAETAPTTPKETAPTTPKEPAPTTPEPSSPTAAEDPATQSEGKSPEAPKEVVPEKKVPEAIPPKEKKVDTEIVEPPPLSDEPFDPTILHTTIPFGIALALTSIAFLFFKKKTKSSVDMLRVMQIPQNDYEIPTLKSKNRYIPYKSAQYRGKRYIYLEGDSGTDSGYTDHYSDITSSSESEYEEFDINDIYAPRAPKYKTLIEVVLEPSKRDTQSDDIPTNKPIADDEWNTIKNEFISQFLQNEQKDMPNILPDNIDNNTHLTPSRDTLDQKPFIMSIHDRNLLSAEEYNYDMSTNSGNNDLYSGQNNLYSGQNNLYSDVDSTSDNRDSYSGTKDPISDKHYPYSGIDLINDALSGDHDIYDEILKRKENELFGTNHTKKNTTNIVSKPTNSDPIMNQLNLFHKWLDRHRDMCEKWNKKNKKEELLDKLKEEWNNENNTNSSLTHTSNIPSGENSIKNVMNADVSIQIDMDNPKLTNEFKNMDTTPNKSTMDTIMDDLEKYNEPYYYDFYKDDIYYDVNDHDTSTVDSNNMEEPTEIQIELDVNNHKLVKEKYPIGDVWDI
ncbi:erythrocyte membrane protein 1, PfEMP1, putative [Plasmodium reichenowi]|uniref:Erythrocyte membrane protein 1, PfEMP1, putative n=1 Tax=Plasmodium reichenowi TaxID=5854 RepID=A0A2P9D5P9_PLARE|nr:erythrocyte membrane protein 1, PfEMP1, putative [Plasmodium reichenowi]